MPTKKASVTQFIRKILRGSLPFLTPLQVEKLSHAAELNSTNASSASVA